MKYPTLQFKSVFTRSEDNRVDLIEEIAINTKNGGRQLPYGLVVDRIKMIPCNDRNGQRNENFQLSRQTFKIKSF